MNLTQKRLLEISNNAISELEFSEYEHEAILKYLQINEDEYKEITSETPKKHYVYTVLFDYSTQDCSGIDIYIFDSYKKAVKKFKQIIEDEKNPDTSWVGDAYTNNELSNEYELDTNIDDIDDNEEHELYWNISCKHDWYLHDFLDLRIKEVE